MKGKFEELQGHFRLEREMTAILTTKIERITETFYMGELHILDASEIFNPEDRTDYTLLTSGADASCLRWIVGVTMGSWFNDRERLFLSGPKNSQNQRLFCDAPLSRGSKGVGRSEAAAPLGIAA